MSGLPDEAVPEPAISERGFAHWRPVQSTYGATVRVYESSTAMAPHLWVAIDGDCHLVETPRPRVGIAGGIAKGDVAAHLTVEQARELHATLGAAIARQEVNG